MSLDDRKRWLLLGACLVGLCFGIWLWLSGESLSVISAQVAELPAAMEGRATDAQATRSSARDSEAVAPAVLLDMTPVADAAPGTCRVMAVDPQHVAIPVASLKVISGAVLLNGGEWPELGQIRVTGEGDDGAVVAVDGGSWGRAQVALSADDVRAGLVEVMLRPSAEMLKGRLVDESGRPAVGQSFSLAFERASAPYLFATTSMSGEFLYPSEAAGLMLAVPLRVRPGSTNRPVPSQFITIGIESEEPLVLVGRSKSGFVIRVTPRVVAFARTLDVELVDANGAPSRQTALQTERGLFVPVDSDGDYRFRVSVSGFLSTWYSARVVEGHGDPVDVELVAQPRLEGRVVDALGQPVPLAWVTVDNSALGARENEWHLSMLVRDLDVPVPSPPGGIEHTDQDGRFSLAFETGLFVVHHPAYVPALFSDVEQLPDPIVLSEGSVIEGAVSPLESAKPYLPMQVTLTSRSVPGTFVPVGVQRMTVGGDGSFRFTAVRSGINGLLVQSAAEETLGRARLEIEPESTTNVNIRLEAPHRIQLMLHGSGEAYYVKFQGEEVGAQAVLTKDHVGDLWFADLDWEGPTSVVVGLPERSPDQVATLLVEPDVSEYEAFMPQGSIRLVVKLNGQPGEFVASLRVLRQSFKSVMSEVRVDDFTWPVADAVSSGTYLAKVVRRHSDSLPGIEVASETFELPDGFSGQHDVLLDVALRTVVFYGETREGLPIKGLRIVTSVAGQAGTSGYTDAAGRVELTVMDRADLSVYAMHHEGTFSAGPRPLPQEASEFTVVAIPETLVDLQLMRSDKSPALGEVLLIYMEGDDYGFNRTARLDKNGTTGTLRMVPGRWLLSLTTGGHAEFTVAKKKQQTLRLTVAGP